MAREIVVERDRDREPLPASPLPHRVEQAIGGNDVVVPGDVPKLLLEEPRLVRRDELPLGIAGPLIHTVVHERNARLATRQPEQEHEAQSHRRAHEPGQRSCHALRE